MASIKDDNAFAWNDPARFTRSERAPARRVGISGATAPGRYSPFCSFCGTGKA